MPVWLSPLISLAFLTALSIAFALRPSRARTTWGRALLLALGAQFCVSALGLAFWGFVFFWFGGGIDPGGIYKSIGPFSLAVCAIMLGIIARTDRRRGRGLWKEVRGAEDSPEPGALPCGTRLENHRKPEMSRWAWLGLAVVFATGGLAFAVAACIPTPCWVATRVCSSESLARSLAFNSRDWTSENKSEFPFLLSPRAGASLELKRRGTRAAPVLSSFLRDMSTDAIAAASTHPWRRDRIVTLIRLLTDSGHPDSEKMLEALLARKDTPDWYKDVVERELGELARKRRGAK